MSSAIGVLAAAGGAAAGGRRPTAQGPQFQPKDPSGRPEALKLPEERAFQVSTINQRLKVLREGKVDVTA